MKNKIKISVISITLVSLFLLSNVVVSAQTGTSFFADYDIDGLQFDELLKDCDEETKDVVQSALLAGLNVYITISSSKERKAFHIFLPFLLRLIKANGLFIIGLIIHRTVTATTSIWRFSLGVPPIPVKTALGRHIVFIIGLGYSGMSRPFYSGGGDIFAFSLTKPLVLL